MSISSTKTLEGRIALVTGAGRVRGIGRGIALALADAGADVVVTDVGARRADLDVGGVGLGDNPVELEETAGCRRSRGGTAATCWTSMRSSARRSHGSQGQALISSTGRSCPYREGNRPAWPDRKPSHVPSDSRTDGQTPTTPPRCGPVNLVGHCGEPLCVQRLGSLSRALRSHPIASADTP